MSEKQFSREAEQLYNFGMMLAICIQASGPTEQWDNLDICKSKVRTLAEQWTNPPSSSSALIDWLTDVPRWGRTWYPDGKALIEPTDLLAAFRAQKKTTL
jgi:hypothetical protein